MLWGAAIDACAVDATERHAALPGFEIFEIRELLSFGSEQLTDAAPTAQWIQVAWRGRGWLRARLRLGSWSSDVHSERQLSPQLGFEFSALQLWLRPLLRQLVIGSSEPRASCLPRLAIGLPSGDFRLLILWSGRLATGESPAEVESGLHWYGESLALGILRRASRYGAGDSWRLAGELRWSRGGVSLRREADGSSLLLRLGAGSWSASVVLPITSIVGAGPGIGIGWSP
jgi:hypothetical protein